MSRQSRCIIIIYFAQKMQVQCTMCMTNELEQQGWITSTNNCPYTHIHTQRQKYASIYNVKQYDPG